MAFNPCGTVLPNNIHIPVVVDPQFAHDDVVDGCRDFSPRITISRSWKVHMRHSQWDHLQVLPAEFGCHCKFLPARPSFALTMYCRHWGMMGNLFSNTSPSQIICPITLIRFPKEWIKWFTRTITCGGVT
uniref:Uncharacterized protein n=1 Tax=Nyssomyia neivai TaxID=330878 RepID=A0A1L8D861_9DIPT